MSIPAPSLAIIGCGDLGGRVAIKLLPLGWRIHAVRRRPLPGEHTLACHQADYTQPGSLAFLAELRPDFILTSLNPAGRDVAGYLSGFRDATANLLDGLGVHEPRHILMVSSTRVYAESEGGWVDETSALSTVDERARAIIAAEELLKESGHSDTIVRCSGLYGDPEGRLLARVRRGELAPSPPLRYTNRIHRDDCAGFLVHLLECSRRGEQLAQIYNGTDDDPAPAHEVERWLAEALGVPDEIRKFTDSAATRGHKRCRNQRLHQCGYRLQYPTYREGYAQVLATGS